jgi:uncharacterized membrane protein HdeD (DUF308 family)
MAKILERSWWALAIGGVVSVLFGLLVFRWPGLALVALITLFGAFALINGIFTIIVAIEGAAHHRSWIWPLVGGAVSVLAGLVTFMWPGITALALLYLIAIWAIVTGVSEIVGALQLRRELPHEWLYIAAGVVSVLFGLFMIARPGKGALTLIWLIGAYAVIYGVLRISLGFRMRSLSRQVAALPISSPVSSSAAPAVR